MSDGVKNNIDDSGELDAEVNELVSELLKDPELRKPILDGVKKSIKIALQINSHDSTARNLALRVGLCITHAGKRIH